MPAGELTETATGRAREDGLDEILAPFEAVTRQIAHALAWLHEPIGPAGLAARLEVAGIRSREGRRLSHAAIMKSIEQLHAAGLLRHDRWGGTYCIEPLVSHVLVAEAYRDAGLLAKLRKFPISEYYGLRSVDAYVQMARYGDEERGHLRVTRDLREAYYDRDAEKLKRVETQSLGILHREPSWEFVLHPLDAERLRALSLDQFRSAMRAARCAAIERLYPAERILSLLVERSEAAMDWRMIGELAMFRGVWQAVDLAEEFFGTGDRPTADVTFFELRGARAFLRGDDGAAIAAFEEAIARWRKVTGRRKYCPTGLFGFWFLAALIRRGRPEDLAAVWKHSEVAAQHDTSFAPHYIVLEDIAEIVGGVRFEGVRRAREKRACEWLHRPEPGFPDLLFFTLASLREQQDVDPKDCAAALDRLRQRAEDNGARWVAAEASALRDAWNPKPSVTEAEQTAALWTRFGPQARPFSASVRAPEAWERTVLALETLGEELAGKGKGGAKKKKGATQKQLVWWLRNSESGGSSLHAIERSVSAGGKPSKGRKVTLKRLKERTAEMPFLTDQDRRVVACIRSRWAWEEGEYEIDMSKALLELAGHPLVFADERATQPVELVKVTPRLAVTETKEGDLKLALTPESDYERAGPELIVESPTRHLVLDRRDVHVRLAELLGRDGGEIPGGAKERVVKALGKLAKQLPIESDEGTLGEVGIATVEADSRPVLRLYPHGNGLHARLMVRPLAGGELTCDPGEGRPMMVAMQDGRQVQARRDLARERDSAAEILAACPTFADCAARDDERWSALLPTPLDALGLLEELHGLGTDDLVVEWPEGQPFRLHSVADCSRFEVSLGGSKDWLTASGQLKLDDELVVTMRQLLDLLESSAETPGYVRLQDGQFLALTREFRRQLEDLRAFSQPGKGEQLRIHPLAALALEDFADGPGVKTGAAWKRQLGKIRAETGTEPAAPPSTLQAELRPYQLEGYRWLRRLAKWGMGACLADDMGLGKTVQALALLIDRALDGPALVVAPTSVAANWLEEAVRFAPTLRPVIFGRPGGDRQEVLGGAGPFDLVISSYGLLQTEAEAFAAVRWHTVILDEAQAIKNRATKRSKAAMRLEAGFRVVTTGTPVENRLAELHNLFHFLNPGLLGSWERFRRQFADPIERRDDAEARERLRRLIRPFILRRLKSEVLRDLPSRTEIALQVELSPEEAAFYEALRRKAVEDLARASAESAEPGRAAIRILAELTRLRRACCHPKLIDPETSLEGSKLRVFGETLEEILGGNHKVLVFSQFVDHLRLIRGHLDGRGISYQYLDGSTPAAKRQEAVRDFQSGMGDVFLISLKAGGFGLNLTAADYVIHMDPWWNPAAEDQASDRAHRIGQTRPVTIYRLITTGTIEEKIVDLHHRKRELADTILEGTDSAGRLSPEELLALLRDGG